MQALEFRRTNDLPTTPDRSRGGPIDPSPLVGTWYSFDKTTRGISKLIVSDRNGVLTLQTFGAAVPSYIDWGPVQSHAFAAGVGSHEGVGFKAFYDFGFLHTVVAAYLNKRLLVVDTYNTFKDDSGRANYFFRDHFYQ